MFDCRKGRGSFETKDCLASRHGALADLLVKSNPLGQCFINSAKAVVQQRKSEAAAQTSATQHLKAVVDLAGNKWAVVSLITDSLCMQHVFVLCRKCLVGVLS
jgi:hypothetical protein